MVFDSHSGKETFEFGRKMGIAAKEGDIITINGDLGTGKTVFTKGLAAGLGIIQPVCSPTFTILQIYDEGRIPLYHFDVYRIEEPEEMNEIGYEDYFYGKGVTVIEWAHLISDILPKDITEINISKDITKGEDYRRIEVFDQPV